MYYATFKGIKKGFDRVSPYFIPSVITNMAAGRIAIKHNLQGMCSCVVTACAGGTNAVGDSFRQIRDGYADVMVCGGAEAGITEISVGGFTTSKALCQSEDPMRASIPFDKERSGFVMGEGAGILVLEELDHALKRNAKIYAEVGVGIGAVMSTGMMDVARHGIMSPDQFSFEEVMTIFLAVMVTDVIVLDMFNTLGMPTSTTVSLVFELLGGTFILATLKIAAAPSLTYGDLLNSDKALSVIIAIFVSVAIAFVFGCIVMWISRNVFTFNYKNHSKYGIGIFGGIAFTALSYFIFLKGLGKSPYIPDGTKEWINDNTQLLLLATFVVSSIVMQLLHLLKVNVFKFVVLMGTFALAMAFAGNDLVNFIGVPLAGLDSYNDYITNSNGANPTEFMMSSLMESAKTPAFYLMLAGVIMIVAMATSKKAQNVIKTSVDLARQDEGDEMFGSS